MTALSNIGALSLYVTHNKFRKANKQIYFSLPLLPAFSKDWVVCFSHGFEPQGFVRKAQTCELGAVGMLRLKHGILKAQILLVYHERSNK